MPALAGTVVSSTRRSSRGPLGAFRWVRRRLHRWLDVGVMVAIVVAAFQPWIEVTAAAKRSCWCACCRSDSCGSTPTGPSDRPAPNVARGERRHRRAHRARRGPHGWDGHASAKNASRNVRRRYGTCRPGGLDLRRGQLGPAEHEQPDVDRGVERTTSPAAPDHGRRTPTRQHGRRRRARLRSASSPTRRSGRRC